MLMRSLIYLNDLRRFDQRVDRFRCSEALPVAEHLPCAVAGRLLNVIVYIQSSNKIISQVAHVLEQCTYGGCA